MAAGGDAFIVLGVFNMPRTSVSRDYGGGR